MKKIRLPYWLDRFICDNHSMIHSKIIRTITDKDGKLIKQKKMIGQSTTANFLQALYAHYNNFTTSSNFGFTAPFTSNHVLRYTDGSYQNQASLEMNMDANVNDDSHGIILGSGTTPPTPMDYVIETLIAHGTGAGQLEYMQMRSSAGVVVSGNKSTLILSRIFINNSGGDITVNEIAMYFRNPATGLPYLFYRDLVTGGDTITNTQTYTVDITIELNT